MDFLKKLFDNTGEKVLKKLEPDIVAINLLEPELAKLSDPELKEPTAKLPPPPPRRRRPEEKRP